ncbi:hypothetical protein P5705_16125 [Pseudomonas entomophila]|uniref:hypothetical protein n=1 Tax=Pseudomonas entomophila TaxID=312306 RepID=UPI0024074272|nr:hypothetical protein [Pseudomonas entomophila]MDF9619172.1 hypothetical protein [Pseudomonas entomophila]
MSIEDSRTLRVLDHEELEQVAGGTDATIMPVMPPVYPKPDVPPPNDIEGPIIRF